MRAVVWALLGVAVGAFLLLVSGGALAYGKVAADTSGYYTASMGGACNGQWGSAAGAALGCAAEKGNAGCGGAEQTGGAHPTWTYRVQCPLPFNQGNVWVSGTVTLHSGSSCPGDAQLVSGECVCMEGFRPSGESNECVSANCAELKGQSANLLAADGMAQSGSDFRACHNGCGFTSQSSGCALGHCFLFEPFIWDGTTCEDGTPGDPNVPGDPTRDGETGPESPCAKGTCPGTVNGASVCVPCSTTTAPPTTETEVKPDGTQTDTETKTECNGTTCTTTTTTTTTGGGTTIKVEIEPQPGFCEENPTFSACQEGRFGGQCQGGFSCEGDAIQCAIAKDQHERHCQMETHTDQSAEGIAMIDGDPHPAGHPRNDAETEEVSFSSAIDQSNPIGGSCPSDVTVNVWGSSSVTIPLSNLCGPLQMVGQVGVAVAMLMAVFIAFKQ